VGFCFLLSDFLLVAFPFVFGNYPSQTLYTPHPSHYCITSDTLSRRTFVSLLSSLRIVAQSTIDVLSLLFPLRDLCACDFSVLDMRSRGGMIVMRRIQMRAIQRQDTVSREARSHTSFRSSVPPDEGRQWYEIQADLEEDFGPPTTTRPHFLLHPCHLSCAQL